MKQSTLWIGPGLLLTLAGCQSPSAPKTRGPDHVSSVSLDPVNAPANPPAASAPAADSDLSPSKAMSRTPFNEMFLFFPAKYPEGDWERDGVDKLDAWFAAEDGVKLHGWYFPCAEPRAVVLYAHGNGGNVADWAPAALVLQQRLKCAVLLFDYHGYGRSEGVPSAQGIVLDGRAARAELARLAQIDPKQIVLLGRSLGGAVVTQLAAEAPARGLILESTFSSYRDVAAEHSGLAILISSDKLNSVAAVAKYRGPLLQSHGDADTIVPLELGRKLFAAAHEPKQFVTVPGGGHNDPPSDNYMHELDRFLEGLPRTTGG